MSAVTGVLNQEQREIVELLCNELAEAMSNDAGALHQTGSERDQLLREFAAQTEQLGKAMELAGLVGLSQCCQLLTQRFTAISTNQHSFDESVIDTLSSWPMALLNYLHPFLDRPFLDSGEIVESQTAEAARDLIAYICADEWPEKLAGPQLQALQQALEQDQVTEDDNFNTAPLLIDAQSSSLQLSDDLRPELLQSLLTELPEQSRGFEASISAFLHKGVIEQLAPAQRIAHTIKGSANIVGIRGLANLMHLSEDLLEQTSKGQFDHQTLPQTSFNDLLIDVADCLGDISDFLTGLGPEPNNVESVLHALANCFQTPNAADAESQASADDSSFSVDSNTIESQRDSKTDTSSVAPQTPATTVDEEANAITAMLSLSQQHAQQLLRIAGESQIANTQFMAQLEAMKTSIEQTERFHRRIKSMAMELEALLQTQNALRSAMYRSNAGEHSDSALDFDPLELESYSELHSFSNQLLELTADSYEAVAHIEAQIDELNTLAYTQRQLNRDNNDLLLRTHMISVDTIVPRLQRCVRQACRLTQKNAVLEIVGDKLQIDNRVLSGIVDPLMHLLRNAVDHGIESDELRIAEGKDSTGKITVEFLQHGEVIQINCRDDGCGLDLGAIRQKAIDKGLIASTENTDDASLSRLLFLPGFSTRDQISQTSGRGIGLDVVQEAVKALKGSVHLSIDASGGCCFSLNAPASILTAHTLLVRVQRQHRSSVLSVLSRGINNIIHIEPSQLQRTSNGRTTFCYQDKDIPVFLLRDLTNLASADADKIHALLVVTRDDGSSVAIGVEQLLASQDLVIKPLNSFTYHPPAVVGATILGDGTVSAVVDINALPGLSMSREDYARLQEQRDAIAAQEGAHQRQLPTALIIDDSLSARQSLSQFVSELGMQVRTAKDGFEAISVLNEVHPDIILVDLEMPRMNGLEFTTHLRADEQTRGIPVIMITSRSTDKHRQMAAKAGVDDYLNKPWSDEALLTSIQQQMQPKSLVASR
jgi:chemosensory pili system protein ChpA (sensor histidine kinase/response regulator)